jgi:hypothetical protein
MKKNIFVNLLLIILLGITVSANAQVADTFNIVTNQDTMQSPPKGYYGWGVFPADTVSYRKVYLNFTLGCGGGCSGWDYTVDIYLIQNTHHKDSTLEQGPTFTVNGSQKDSVKVKFDTTYTTYFDTTTHQTDSTANTAYTIVQYKNCSMPTTPTDTVYWWVAGYYNYYYNSSDVKIDSIYVTPDTSMYLSFCPYYSVYDSLVSYEIARMITPYGGYYSGAWTYPYRFDVTDFSSLLHDSVQIEVFYSGWTNQFTANCNFEVITGIPDHNPYMVTNLWSGSFPYGSTGNPISNYLTPYAAHIDTGAYATRLRILQTGHGEDNNNCTEFCANYQHMYVNGVQRFNPFVWRDDCGLNALLNQAGTWLYDRAHWCPGDLVNPYLDDLTPYVTRGGVDTLLITMDPYTSPNGGSIYIFGTSLVYYGRPNFQLDAAIEDILAPNTYAPYSRINPVCGSPEVVIRNTGADTLKSLLLNYGQVGGAHFNYTWTGDLPFDDTALVYLPPVDLKSSTTNKFEVTIGNPNGSEDQYPNNNYMQVPYDTVPTYPSSFIIRLTTNLVGYQYSYFIEDGNGNIVHSKSGFANSTTYHDTVHLAPGCYHFELDASGEQGLYFFANSNGTGALEFQKIGGYSFNTFQADFGTSICQNFDVGVVTGSGDLEYAVDYTVYPNPAKDQLTIGGLDASKKDKTVRIYSSVGELVYDNTVKAGLSLYSINLGGFASGIYCVVVSNGDGQVVKKVMISK